MKIITIVTLASFIYCNIAFATIYQANCLNDKGKFSDCKINIESTQISINSKKITTIIDGSKVKNLTSGDYSRRRIGEAVGTAIFTFGIGALVAFGKKKLDQIGIEYIDDTNKPKSTLIQIKKKYGMALRQELKAATGLEFQLDETTTNKTK